MRRPARELAERIAAPLGRRRVRRWRERADHELERCPACGQDYVNPVEWEPADASHWWMLLRCGWCDMWREVTVSDALAARFDAELDRRVYLLERSLHRLDLQRMAGEVETMIGALRRGLIDAADFAR